MSESQPAIVFDDVSVTLGGIRILESVTASVPKGATTAVIGPNGAGKTTLILALLGQVPHTGSIRYNGGGRHAPPKIGYVPQRLDFDRGTPVTVMEAMVMGAQRSPLWFGARRVYRERAIHALTAVHADHLASRKLGVLSGGELQRVLLAIAVQEEPEILLLDEPASGVDVAGEDILCELLDELHNRLGFTQVMVNHDLSTVLAHASHVICLNRRVVAYGPTESTLTDAILHATFGIHLGLVDATTCRLPVRHDEHSAHGEPK